MWQNAPMPLPHPNKLRHRIVNALEAGERKQDVMKRFHVSQMYVYRVWKHYCKTGSKDRQPQSHHGPLGSVTEPLKKKIASALQKRPQSTSEDIQGMLQRHNVMLSRSRVNQIMFSLGFTRAKRKAMLAANGNSRGKRVVRKRSASA
jgi:transposase